MQTADLYLRWSHGPTLCFCPLPQAELQPRIQFLNANGAGRTFTTNINVFFHVICSGSCAGSLNPSVIRRTLLRGILHSLRHVATPILLQQPPDTVLSFAAADNFDGCPYVTPTMITNQVNVLNQAFNPSNFNFVHASTDYTNRSIW